MSRTTPFTLAFLVAASMVGESAAGEILLRADRDRIQQGEHVMITITVRGSRTKPMITPPNVPYCQIEAAGEKLSRPQLTSGGSGKTGAAGTNQRLADSISGLDQRLQEMAGELNKQGLGGPSLTGDYSSMLKDIRKQAIEALNSGTGPVDFEARYRVTPLRTGELKLPAFQVKVGSQTYLAKPPILTINPPAIGSAPNSKNAPLATPQTALEANIPPPVIATAARGFDLQPWQWIAVLLAGPLVGGIAYYVIFRRNAAHAPIKQASFAPPLALHALHDARTAEDVERYLTELVRARGRLPKGEITPAEACTALHGSGVPLDLAERFAMLLDECTAARFAPRPVAVATHVVVHQARQLVAELARVR